MEAFSITAAYDSAIYNGLWRRFEGEPKLPERFLLSASKFQDAKYGENPDQKATIYSVDGSRNMTQWKQLAGDTLSFNNYLDIGSAYDILEGFEEAPRGGHGEARKHQRFRVSPRQSRSRTSSRTPATLRQTSGGR